MLSRLTGPDAPGATAPGPVPREVWPSWERYICEEEKTLSMDSLFLLDGTRGLLESRSVLGYLRQSQRQQKTPQKPWFPGGFARASYQNRTDDLFITSETLYRLS